LDGVKLRRYVVVKCFNCHSILVLNLYYSQRRCPYCGKKVTANSALTNLRFTAKEASEIAKDLKVKQHLQEINLKVLHRLEKDLHNYSHKQQPDQASNT
jgi:RNA polymerase subunit RPABC4/transcription elongation factor Spt4